ncbi:MAG TPA: DUF1501 domain-containing protein [Chthoniobacteraceae bacterium]|jgi:uncharacterized protein (DUF1501 family)|nr:DUF1501 domain-containing protein [Chthoniobacteraceae bacterium]
MSTQTLITGNRDARQTLVVVFLRGAADGLSMVAPLEDDHYHRARPRIAVKKKEAIPLDGFFGLNPLLADLKPAWDEGELCIVHGAGSEDQTRSHFVAQEFMEHGGVAAGGWLGRFLRVRPEPVSGALACVAVGKTLPEVLLGAPNATVMQSLDDFTLGSGAASFSPELERLYQLDGGSLQAAASDTFDALRRIDSMRQAQPAAAHGAAYGDDEFGQSLRQVARLIKADVGLEVASVDLDNWDTHWTQQSWIEPLLRRLNSGLAAFRQDLGPRFAQTTVVVMTEFGRRVAENSAFGTDHGRGGVLFAMGGGVKGGRVFGEDGQPGLWRGLAEERLEGPGDLPVFNNYRNVLAPILHRHGGPADLSKVFPDFTLKPLDLYG